MSKPTTAPILPEPFRWLFIAHFADGSMLMQDPDDHQPGSNSFKKVLARQDELVAFELQTTDGKQSVGVDLKGGYFVVNGTPMVVHDQFFDPTKHQLKLVYYREKQELSTATATMQEDGTVSMSDLKAERSFVNRYFVGWQTTLKRPIKTPYKTFKGNIVTTVAVG